MIETFMRLGLERCIPAEVLAGLITGQYSLHGGVIRWASGTELGGQIVRHLVPVGQQAISASPLFAPISSVLGAVNTYQLHRVSGQVGALADTTQQVLSIATNTMMLSGLNLAVSALGFSVLKQKLDKLEAQLSQIKQEVKAIRELLELKERAELAAALTDLLRTVTIADMREEHRHKLLSEARTRLGPIVHKYKELLEKADNLEKAMGYEEYFCLTSLAHARCSADLGMLSLAKEEMEEAYVVWKKQAQRIANQHLLKKQPERFLYSDFCQDLPVSVLVKCLDFAYGEQKGYGWFDELRGKTEPWHKEIGELQIGLLRPGGRKLAIREERKQILPALQKLVARNDVLDGFVAQYGLLEKHDETPGGFERKIASFPPHSAVDGYFILKPKTDES